jgi:hypothetical protein
MISRKRYVSKQASYSDDTMMMEQGGVQKSRYNLIVQRIYYFVLYNWPLVSKVDCAALNNLASPDYILSWLGATHLPISKCSRERETKSRRDYKHIPIPEYFQLTNVPHTATVPTYVQYLWYTIIIEGKRVFELLPLEILSSV